MNGIAGKRRHQDRRCVGTGEALAPDAPALRFVAGPEGEIVLDLRGSLPGRGAWLTPERGALLAALKRGGFARAFKAPAKLAGGMDAEAFADAVAEQLARSALDALGLCRRAGRLVIGSEHIRNVRRDLLAYLTASDASEPETRKLASLLHKAHGVPHFPLPADRRRLGPALGQEAVHLLLLAGGPAPGALGKIILWRGFAG